MQIFPLPVHRFRYWCGRSRRSQAHPKSPARAPGTLQDRNAPTKTAAPAANEMSVSKRKRNIGWEVRLCRMKPCAIYSRGMQASTWNARSASSQTLGLFAIALLLLMTAPARSQKTPPAKPRASTGNSAWVESTLKKMTVREKIGQMLMPYYFGVFTSTESVAYKELLHQVEDNHVGGFIVGTIRSPLGHRAQPGLLHGGDHQRASVSRQNSSPHQCRF